MYLIYTTPNSEGTVVAHSTDSKFAIGYNPLTGDIVYVDTIKEIPCTSMDMTSDINKAAQSDTALYMRSYTNKEEYDKFFAIRGICLERGYQEFVKGI